MKKQQQQSSVFVERTNRAHRAHHRLRQVKRAKDQQAKRAQSRAVTTRRSRLDLEAIPARTLYKKLELHQDSTQDEAQPSQPETPVSTEPKVETVEAIASKPKQFTSSPAVRLSPQPVMNLTSTPKKPNMQKIPAVTPTLKPKPSVSRTSSSERKLQVFVLRSVVKWLNHEYQAALAAKDNEHYKSSPANIKQSKISKNSLFSRFRMVAATAVVVLIVGFGGIVAWRSHSTSNLAQSVKPASSQIARADSASSNLSNSTVSSNNSTEELDESDPPPLSAHVVAPDKPRYVRIPRLNKVGRIVEVGMSNTNELLAPKNIHNAGWYTGSALPGSGSGTAVLDAHLTGTTRPGLFYGVRYMDEGDQIEIELGSGDIVMYEVAAKETVDYSEVDIQKALTSISPGKEGLTLITSGGDYDADTGSYVKRDIIYATRVN